VSSRIHSISPEFVPDRVIAGDWALAAGVVLVAIGCLLARARSPRVLGWLLVCGWLVAATSSAGGVATIVALMVESNGPPRPSIEFGVFLAAASSVFAMLGVALVTAGRAPESKPAASQVSLPRRDTPDLQRGAPRCSDAATSLELEAHCGHSVPVDERFTATMRATDLISARLVGRSESAARSEAEAHGREVHVEYRDGVSLGFRTKLDPRRIRVSVDGGTVMAAQVG
jgi:hypothetical protein